MCARNLQVFGGGLYIEGTAGLINSAVYQNQASVCRASEHIWTLQRPLERYVLSLRCGQDGGGLNIHGTATLMDSNVFANVAENVRSPPAPF